MRTRPAFAGSALSALSALSAGSAALLGLALITGCADRTAGGWTDTETGTKLSGVILEEGGGPAAGARVSLRPSDYLAKDPTQPDSSGPRRAGVLDGFCDSAGRFSFDSVPEGEYLVEARTDDRGALIPAAVDEESDEISLPAAALQPFGRIQGRVVFSDSVPGAALVRVYGMERARLTDPATGAFTLENMPAGSISLHASGLEPFILPVKKPGIEVQPASLAIAGDIVLQRKLKQAFSIVDGRLEIPGVDSTNPVIFENGAFLNPVDGAYLWAKASLGRLDLRGTIVSYGKATGDSALQTNLRNCMSLIQAARASGMRGVLDPVAGARYKLAAAPSGRLEDIEPVPTQGGLLLIHEAYRASADKPLIVISGASLTTVAEALLRDPAIANRMVVIGANNGNINNSDSLASAVVSKKARLVEWARDYYWDNSGFARRSPDAFPTNRLGEALRKQFLIDTSKIWSYAFFADFGAATYLFNQRVWSSARAGNLKIAATAAVPAPAAGLDPFDYVDIPKEANDWTAIHDEFFQAIADPAAYHAWPAPGKVAGGAFHANLRVQPSGDPALPHLGAYWTGRGSWAEYRLTVDQAGEYVVALRVRSDMPAGLKITDMASGASVAVTALPTVTPEILNVTLPLTAGLRTLRIESTRSPFTLEDFTLHSP